MENGHWERAKELFSRALDEPPETRHAFLRRACGADDDLFHDISRLLDAQSRSSTELSRPFLQLALGAPRDEPPRFEAPAVVANRFRIIGLIERGGMGEVYAAEDLQLGVRVALKTIRPEIAADRRVLELFKNEIQMARRVTHPSVCRIYDLAEHEDLAPDGNHRVTYCLTMELLTGETLSAHLRRHGPLTPEDARVIAAQLAEALQAAHDAGVIHRDFKPGNVMLVQAAGRFRAVVMDFGLAVVREQAGLRSPSDAPGGTPAYMAPEQYAGGEVTTATDVFSLGLVIAELAGARIPKRNAAQGDTTGDFPGTIELPSALQPWEPVLRRCLDSDPVMRYWQPSAVAQALDTAAAPSPPVPGRRRLRFVPITGTAVLGLGLTIVAVQRYVWPSENSLDPVQLTRIADKPETEIGASFSPDGKTVAYLRGARVTDEIMLLSEGSTQPRRLVKSSLPLGQRPVWTPDGSHVCYGVNRVPNFWCVEAAGGEPSLLLEGEVASPQFTPDGKSLVFLRRVNGKMAIVHSTPPGAAPMPLDFELTGETSLLLSPDGSKLATARFGGTVEGVSVRPYKGGPARQLVGEPGWNLTGFYSWFPDNRHLFLAETSVEQRTRRMVIVDSESAARRLVLTNSAVISSAALSPDGRQIVYASSGNEEGASIYEFSTDGRRTRVVMPNSFNGVWTPGEGGILYETEGNGRPSATWAQEPDGAVPVRLRNAANLAVYSPDGRRIAYKVLGEQNGIETMPSTGGEPTEVLRISGRFTQGGPCWSADGQWLFYFHDNKLWRISSAGGGQPKAVADVLRGLTCSPSGRTVQYYPLPKRPVAPGEFANEIAVMSTDTLVVRPILLKRDLLLASGAVSPDGKFLYAPLIDRQSLEVLDMRTGKVIRTIRLNLDPTESIETMSVHSDGQRLLVTTQSQPVDLWRAEGFSVPERGWLRWLRHWAPPERRF